MSLLAIPLTARQRRIAQGAVVAAARAGYASRGFVYLSFGLLALRAAYDLRRVPAGARAAVAPIGQAPLGGLWLALIAAGLLGFALWRALQAAADADRQGTGAKALAQRIGQGMSGLGYAVLALSILTLLDNLEDARESDDAGKAAAFAAQVMNLPFGQTLMAGAGVVIVALGLLNVAHALDRRFQSALDCSVALKPWAGAIGRAGYAARGLAFILMGASLLRAGFTLQASEVTGLGGALTALKALPGGPWVLSLMAIGLIAFGAFGLIEARYRRLRAPGG